MQHQSTESVAHRFTLFEARGPEMEKVLRPHTESKHAAVWSKYLKETTFSLSVNEMLSIISLTVSPWSISKQINDTKQHLYVSLIFERVATAMHKLAGMENGLAQAVDLCIWFKCDRANKSVFFTARLLSSDRSGPDIALRRLLEKARQCYEDSGTFTYVNAAQHFRNLTTARFQHCDCFAHGRKRDYSACNGRTFEAGIRALEEYARFEIQVQVAIAIRGRLPQELEDMIIAETLAVEEISKNWRFRYWVVAKSSNGLEKLTQVLCLLDNNAGSGL